MTIAIAARIGKKGQVVIPKLIRDANDLRAGMTIRFWVEEDKLIIESGTDVLDEFFDAMEKTPEPNSVDWDEQYYAQVE